MATVRTDADRIQLAKSPTEEKGKSPPGDRSSNQRAGIVGKASSARDGGTSGARGALLPGDIGIDLEVEEWDLGRWGDGGVGKRCGRVICEKNVQAGILGGKGKEIRA